MIAIIHEPVEGGDFNTRPANVVGCGALFVIGKIEWLTFMNRVKHKSEKIQVAPVEGDDHELDVIAKEAFLHFIEYHPARRLNRNLRRMLLEFLVHDGAVENLYFEDLILDLEGLFELLDVLEDCQLHNRR